MELQETMHFFLSVFYNLADAHLILRRRSYEYHVLFWVLQHYLLSINPCRSHTPFYFIVSPYLLTQWH